MPYLIFGMPIAAIFVALVPLHTSLATLLIFMIALNLSMAIFRSPTIALMPDITPEKQRTKANGIINFMGGVGAIIAFGVGGTLYKLNHSLPFFLASAIIFISLIILLKTIKEKRDTIEYKAHVKPKINYKEELNRPTVFILLAIFFWFVSYQGMEALFTLYGVNKIGMAEHEATFSLAFFSLTFVLFAIPSGWLGAKFGKKRIISIGVVGLALTFFALSFVSSVLLLRIILLIGGIFWSCININSYPFIVSTGNEHSIGTRTGLYYLVSSLAAITGPPLFGQIIDLTNDYTFLFYSATLSMILALVCISFVNNSGKTTTTEQNIINSNQ